MISVCNSSPLIYLVKLNKLNLLKKIYEKVFIPEEVFEEVVLEGKRLNQKEVLLIEKEIGEGFIVVKKSGRVKKLRDLSHLHKGEICAISLCLNFNEKNILIDDKEAYKICQLLDLNPVRTSAIFIRFFKEKLIGFEEYKKLLIDLSNEGYYIDIETFNYLLNEASRYEKV